MPVGGILPGEFDAEAGVASGNQNCSHPVLTSELTCFFPRHAISSTPELTTINQSVTHF
jgi:hypothetical protein